MAQNIIGGPDIVFFVCFVFFFLTLSPGCCRWRSIPQSPSCYSLNQPNIRVKLTSSGGVNWKSEKSGRGGKKGGRERKKHVTLITSMPAGPHSPCFFPPFFFLCHLPLSEDVHEYDREVYRGDANSEIKRMISLGGKKKAVWWWLEEEIGGRDGGLAVHLTAFSLDSFPSALELSHYVSISLSQTLWMEQEAVISG